MYRTGKLSNDDGAFIKSSAGQLSPAEIARRINRREEFVKGYIEKHCGPAKPAPMVPAAQTLATDETITIRQELRASETWRRLKDEFSADELRYFEERYIKVMTQMRGDVIPTEETQIFQLIKFELLMSRNLMGRKTAQEDIIRLERAQKEFLAPFDGDPASMSEEQKVFSLNLDSSIREARTAEATRTNEYVKLQERHDSLNKTLKATRDQRFDKIEKEGVDFIGVIRQLSQRDIQEQEGRQMELMKLAANKELTRLGRPHTYDDKSQDSPILCADTVDMGPEEVPPLTEEETL